MWWFRSDRDCVPRDINNRSGTHTASTEHHYHLRTDPGGNDIDHYSGHNHDDPNAANDYEYDYDDPSADDDYDSGADDDHEHNNKPAGDHNYAGTNNNCCPVDVCRGPR